ncbi:hypothetical protein D3C79_778510 [compost metagenome]
MPDRRTSPEGYRERRLDHHVQRGAHAVTLHHQRRVIDRHEGHNETGQGNAHRPEADQQAFFLGNRGRCKACQCHWRRQVGQDAEIEHEHVRDDQRDPELQQGGGGNGAGDDVVGDGRDAHTQYQAGEHGQHQREEQVVPSQVKDVSGKGGGQAGQRDDADNDADQRTGNAHRHRMTGTLREGHDACVQGGTAALDKAARNGQAGNDHQDHPDPHAEKT